MPIQASCSCGHAFPAPSKYAGKKVKCPQCKQPLVVPKKKQTGSAPAAKVSVRCKCGKSIQAKAELVGKKVRCPGCGEPLTIADSKSASAGGTQEKAAAKAAEPNMGDLFDEIGFAPEVDGGPGRKCPECKAAMKPEAILCIQCGYNENLGRKMDVVRPVTASERAKRAAQQTDAQASKRKASKASSGGKQKLMLLAVVLVAAVALVFVAKTQGWLPQ